MRSFVLPVLLAASIGLPFLMFNNNSNRNPLQNQTTAQNRFGGQASYGIPAYQGSTGYAQSPPPIQTFPGANGQFVSNQTVPPGIPTHFASSPIPPAMRSIPASGTVILPGTANGPDLTAAPMEFLPTTNLAELFRFDVSPDWVKNRWPRVSTAPTEPGLHGMRVVLVTGTNQNDLHGSLTYHFDANHRVQRVSFQGWTGDTTRLLRLMTQTYNFRSHPTLYAGLYLTGNRNGQTGALIMRNPDVVRAENPNQKIAVFLEVNNPNGNFVLSQAMQQNVNVASSTR